MRDLELFATFVAVLDAGSVSAAAARSGLSQPSVSERVAALERHLGVTLFERTSRGARPTAAARRLALQVAGPVHQLRSAWAAPHTAESGPVRVGASSDLAAGLVLPRLRERIADGLAVRFVPGADADLLALLRDGALDVVVSSAGSRSHELQARLVADHGFVLVSSADHAASIDPALLEGDPLQALAHLPVIAEDERVSLIRRYWRAEFGGRLENEVRLIAPDLRAVLAAATAGIGIAVLPRYLAEPAQGCGSVSVLHRGEAPPFETLHVTFAASDATPATHEVVARLTDPEAAASTT